ncbi:MAG: MarR family transcriptional regulator [Caldilineales bacterium]|nr:MarR family transcriptional regulator [Caldilineales bacterium]
MPPEPICHTTGFLLARLCGAHRRAVGHELEALGLHPGQEMFMEQLWMQEGRTQNELAELLAVQPATISKMYQRLEQAGLVTKCTHEEDSRAVRVRLTDKGRALREATEAAWSEAEARLLAHMTVEEKIIFRRLLLQAAENLSEQPYP